VTGMSHEPDLDDAAQAFVHRTMEAIKREFDGDPQVPRFVVVVEMPPDGRIGIASTGDDNIDTHRMLALGAASVRNTMTPAEKQKARQQWQLARAGFERRQ
jgi:hypothetical protein